MAGLLCVLFAMAGCEVELSRDLSERHANEALLALREAGLRAEKRLEQRGTGGRPSSFVLVVPRSEEARALDTLSRRGLPRPPARQSSAGGKLLFSPAVEWAEHTADLSAELTDTLERLPEVSEARVHLALPEPEQLSPLGTPRPTASVLLKLRAPLSIKPSEVAELLAHAVPGLEAADVAVISALPPSRVTTVPAAVPLIAVGPLLLSPESRPLALFLYGLVFVLLVCCGVLLRLAWPSKKDA